jgi:hypothetical protein
VRIADGSFRSAGVQLPGGGASASAVPARTEASNVRLVNRARCATGTPIMVVRYCGKRSVARCADDLWAAIEKGAQAAAKRQGTSDPARWRSPTVKIAFTPLPLADMQYTNRPSGIHQVMQFGG